MIPIVAARRSLEPIPGKAKLLVKPIVVYYLPPQLGFLRNTRADFCQGIGIKALTEKTIVSSRLQRTAASRFSDGFPLIRFLCEALELPV